MVAQWTDGNLFSAVKERKQNVKKEEKYQENKKRKGKKRENENYKQFFFVFLEQNKALFWFVQSKANTSQSRAAVQTIRPKY